MEGSNARECRSLKAFSGGPARSMEVNIGMRRASLDTGRDRPSHNVHDGGMPMIVQFVQFETSLSEEEVAAVAEERLPEFRAIPSLVQKYYLKLDKPNHYGGFYIWESPEALAEFRNSDLAKSIPSAYKIVGAPDVRIYEVMFPLRP
jgi:heme-degrading monooxygenase HmoA